MARLAALLGMLVLAVPAAAPGAPARTAVAGAPAARTLYVDGDSLAVGTLLYLPRLLPGWEIRTRARKGRHAVEGVRAIRALGGGLPRVVVVDLGTNDDPREVAAFTSAVRSVLDAAGASRCVIWPTIARPPYRGVSYARLNAVLHRFDRASAALRVFDWRRTATANPRLLRADRVHATLAGYRERAERLARLVESC